MPRTSECLKSSIRLLRALLARRPVRFLLVGAINTGFGLLAYSAAVLAGFPVPAALAFSLAAGVCFNFLTTGTLVFQASRLRMLFPFGLAYGAIYLVNLGLLALIGRWLDSPILSQLAAAAPMAVFSYWLMSNFVFVTKDIQALPGQRRH
jgi:putative flippase GtrA